MRKNKVGIEGDHHMSSPPVSGSCLCGTVKYEIFPPFVTFGYCHCLRCRKASGSAHTSNLIADPAHFRWTSGADFVIRYDHPEARSFATCFCRECGSPLPHKTRSGRELIVPAGSLDEDPGLRPEHHIFWESRAVWWSTEDTLPRFTEYPPGS